MWRICSSYNTEAVSLVSVAGSLATGDVEMKLDEKVISYFESCNSPVDKEGFLYKKVSQTISQLH